MSSLNPLLNRRQTLEPAGLAEQHIKAGNGEEVHDLGPGDGVSAAPVLDDLDDPHDALLAEQPRVGVLSDVLEVMLEDPAARPLCCAAIADEGVSWRHV